MVRSSKSRWIGGAVFLVVVGLLALASARPAAAANPNRVAFPPKSHPYGKSYGNWGAAWWKWAGDFPLAANPITEGSGPVDYGDAGDQPPGQVWFLAGTFGDGAVERDLTVPEGKALFFPLANFAFWAPEDCEWLGIDEDSCDAEHLTAAIEEYADATYDLVVEVNDESLNNLANYRGTSAPFALDILPGSMWTDFGYDEGVRDPTVSGGHWMFLKPLPVGEHVVHWEARNTNAGDSWFQDVTYNLTVEED